MRAQFFKDFVRQPARRLHRLRAGHRYELANNRKYLSRLHERLGEARLNVVRAFERIGLELFAEPTDGMFVWARLPQVDDSLALAEMPQREGIVLAPGTVFRPHLERSPWMRFNASACEDKRVQLWLERQVAGKA